MSKDVLFICGSDEHGAAITIKAQKEKTTPRQIIDLYHAQFQETFKRIGILFDEYHRTSDPLHHTTSSDYFKALYDQGAFVEQESEQYYDEQAGSFLADRYIMGTCPRCNHPDAYGDQCEKCGSTLNPTDLIQPRSTLSGATPILRKTRHWYLPLNQHESWLREWINTGNLDGQAHHNPESWKAHVLGQCNSWLDSGLQPRAMTRDLDWGVDVPKEIPGGKGKKLYVWLDAPIGYISATKSWAEKNNTSWESWWKNPNTALIHFIGKDNIVFHCLIFPVILKLGGGYNLPVNVPANQFMNLEGQKISTSRNWAVWVHEYLDDLPGWEDALRYHLVRNMPEQRDSEFTWKNFQETVNNELVGNLANFIHRVLVLTHKFYAGKVPDYNPKGTIISSDESGGVNTFPDQEMMKLHQMLKEVSNACKRFEFRNALRLSMEISSMGNRLLQNNEPWKLIKTNPEQVKNVMFLGMQVVGALNVALQPFLPFTTSKLRRMCNLWDFPKEQGQMIQAMATLAEGDPLIAPEHGIGEAEHLFTRFTDEQVQQQIEKLEKSSAANSQATGTKKYVPMKDNIHIDDFSKIDIRTGIILEAEKVPKADKLLKLTVDLGFEKRTVVSGIAEYYQPADIIGRKVLLCANLEPRTLKGITSQGMILMAKQEDGSLVFVQPDGGEPGMTVS